MIVQRIKCFFGFHDYQQKEEHSSYKDYVTGFEHYRVRFIELCKHCKKEKQV